MQRCRTCCRADKYTVDDAQKIARDYRNQVGASKRSVSEYDGKPEPSATTDVSGKRKSADAAAAAIGKKFDQKSVLRFRRGVVGQQPEYTLTGVKDPVAALRVLKEHGIEGARVEDGKLIFVDESKKLGGNLKSGPTNWVLSSASGEAMPSSLPTKSTTEYCKPMSSSRVS